MKTKMTRMNTYPQFYFHIKSLIKLELVIPHFSLRMDYNHYYLHNTCYHPNLVKTKTLNLLESKLTYYLS